MIKNVKEHIRFHYLLIEVQLYTFILLELDIFLKKYLKKIKDKLIVYNIFETKDLLCVDFIVLLSLNKRLREKIC